MDICSIWSYEDILNSGYLGERQARVLAIFSMNPDRSFTGTEIVQMMSGRAFSENTRNRITELEQYGFLDKVDMVEDVHSNKVVNRWRYNGRTKPRKWREEETPCSKCSGNGKVIVKHYYDEPKGDLFI